MSNLLVWTVTVFLHGDLGVPIVLRARVRGSVARGVGIVDEVDPNHSCGELLSITVTTWMAGLEDSYRINFWSGVKKIFTCGSGDQLELVTICWRLSGGTGPLEFVQVELFTGIGPAELSNFVGVSFVGEVPFCI